MTAPTTGWPPVHLADLDVKVRQYLAAVHATAAIIFDHQTEVVRIDPVFAVDLDTEPQL